MDKLKKIINSPISIILALTLLVIGLLIYTRFLIRSVELYSFSGYTEEFSIINGTIFTSNNLNYFGDSKIIYNGENKTIYDFKIGYYIKENEDYIVISEAKILDSAQEENVGVDLNSLLINTDLSFTESHKDAMYLSNKNMENLNNLVFRITGQDENKAEISFEVPIDTVKIK